MYLAIESSCDESALALFDPAVGMVGDWVHSQIALHQTYGGVVPDLASREHLDNFPPLLEALREAQDLAAVREIVVTRGPGLAGCLALGLALGKALALALQVPLRGANHLRGHAWSPFIALHAEAPDAFGERLQGLLPHLGLIVSGGNSILFEIDTARRIAVLAETIDDAAGEALDKGAKLLGMPYPGGPLIEKTAASGDPARFDFPRARPAASAGGLPPFSFSGLKTSLRYRLEAMSDAELERDLPDLCASYQAAVVDQLMHRVKAACKGRAYRSLGLSGGVANNRTLRGRLQAFAEKRAVPALLAEPRHTGDNAAMIAFAAWVDPAHLSGERQGLALGIEPALRL